MFHVLCTLSEENIADSQKYVKGSVTNRDKYQIFILLQSLTLSDMPANQNIRSLIENMPA